MPLEPAAGVPVTLQQDLHPALLPCVNEDICESGLDSWVQISGCSRIKWIPPGRAQSEHGENLRNTEADVGDQHFGDLGDLRTLTSKTGLPSARGTIESRGSILGPEPQSHVFLKCDARSTLPRPMHLHPDPVTRVSRPLRTRAGGAHVNGLRVGPSVSAYPDRGLDAGQNVP